jgi:gamma-tubulin complex component 5
MMERLRLLKDSTQPSISREDDDGEAELYYALRHRLLWFSNTIYTYLTALVLVPYTAKMRQQLSAAEDMDAMVAVHENYMARLEDQCLLSPKLAPIHQTIISLLDLTILLYDARMLFGGEKLFDTTNRSISIHMGQLPPSSQRDRLRHRRRRCRRRLHVSEESDDGMDSSSSSDEHSTEEADTSYISFQEIAYSERLRKMREQFERLCGFASAGLRGVARAGGESCWEMLAEKLEVGSTW